MTMLALRKRRPEPGLAFTKVGRPVPEAGEVLVAVELAGICGTDLHIADWTGGYEAMNPIMPVTLGHEFSGRIVEGPEARVGQRVVVRPSVTCGACAYCSSGAPDRCLMRTGIGILRDGGFTGLAAVPEINCLPVGGMDPEIAALTEPMTVGWQAVRAAGIGSRDRVLVIGPGPIGLGAALFARAAGARLTIAGRNDAVRLGMARSLDLGATLDTAGQSLRSALASIGEDTPYDVIIEATGVARIIAEAQGVLAQGGTLTVVGIHHDPIELDPTRLVRLAQTVRGSYRAPIEAWPAVIDALARDPETFRRLITHRLPLGEALAGFDLLRQREAVKVMLRPEAP